MPAFLGDPKLAVWDSNGNPGTGMQLYTYVAGTTTPKATYPTIADANALTNANANPVVFDARGEAVVVLLDSAYKFILKDSSDNTVWTVDNFTMPSGGGGGGGGTTSYLYDGLSAVVVNASGTSLVLGNGNTTSYALTAPTITETASTSITNSGGTVTYNGTTSYKAQVNGVDHVALTTSGGTYGSGLSANTFGGTTVTLGGTGSTTVAQKIGSTTISNITSSTAVWGAPTTTTTTIDGSTINLGSSATGNVNLNIGANAYLAAAASGITVGYSGQPVLLNGSSTKLTLDQPITDSSGNNYLGFVKTASAVNYVTVTNAQTLNGPSINAAGTDTNIDLLLTPKGTGKTTFNGTVGVRFANNQPLLDSSNNELLKWSSTASAVNELTVTNAATGNTPVISATGNDTNISVGLTAKGTGGLIVSGSGGVRLNSDQPLLDSSGNAYLSFSKTASAVNAFTITNNASGSSPTFAATGTDSNVSIGLQAKGSGTVRVLGNSTQAGSLALYENTANGTNSITHKAPESLASDYTLTWPSALPGSTLYLTCSTGGQLNFASAGSGGIITQVYDDASFVVFDGTGTTVTIGGSDTTTVNMKLAANTYLTYTTNSLTAGISTGTVTFNGTKINLAGDQPIADSSGNEYIKFSKTASAVNEITVTNAATAGVPTISATGDDTNISLALNPKGTGTVRLSGSSGVTLASDQPIVDSSSNEYIKFSKTGSAVNEFTVTNNATGSNPILSATGGDTNIGIDLQTKGTGVIRALGTATGSGTLRFFEQTGSGSNYAGLAAPATLAGDYTLTLPTALPGSTQFLQCTSAGVLSFGSGGGYTQLATGTASASSSIAFTSLTGYTIYVIYINNCTLGTNNSSLDMQFSTDGGSSYDTSTGNYGYGQISNDAGSAGATNATSNAGIRIATSMSSTSTRPMSMVVICFNMSSSSQYKFAQCTFGGMDQGAGSYRNGHIAGVWKNTANAPTALRFIANSGTIATGNFQIYGIT